MREADGRLPHVGQDTDDDDDTSISLLVHVRGGAHCSLGDTFKTHHPASPRPPGF